MDVFSGLLGLGQNLALAIPAFLFVLLIVVFFHELGHFLVARWCGVKVSTFSIGFGAELFGWNDRHGTRWRLAAVPLGGYVKFIDDENAASLPSPERKAELAAAGEDGTFHGKPLWRRALIVAAGPIANFIVAIVVFACIFATYGKRDLPAVVAGVVAGGAAEKAGIKAGDLIVAVDGYGIESFGDLQRMVGTSADTQLKLSIKRGSETLDIVATPTRAELKDRFGNIVKIGRLGINSTDDQSQWVNKRFSPLGAIVEGTRETWFIIDRTLNFIGRLFRGLESTDQIGGPVRIAQVSGQVASVGALALINLAALLSISVGLINLFPVPMLDGGHLMFYAIEAIRGRPLSDRIQEIGFRIGLALVIMLMVFATWNDLVQLFAVT